MKLFQNLLLGSAALAVLAPHSNAHFRLIEPPQWIEQSQNGDPQKAPPCGGPLADGTSADPGKPTNAVVKVQGGEKLHIKLREPIFHPGFCRIALSVNSRAELPRDPEPRAEQPPFPPLIANGLWAHTSPVDKDLETDVEIPNVSCAKCTLQIIEFMANHALTKDGYYYHCVDLQIRPNASKPIDLRYPGQKKETAAR
jgi:hypothetical protein